MQEVGQAGDPLLGMNMIFDGDISWDNHMSKDLKGSCRNLYMRGPMVENVLQTMEIDMV